jgi:hypothetical protein
MRNRMHSPNIKIINAFIYVMEKKVDRLSKWSEFLATDPEIPGSIPGANRFSEKGVCNGVHSASWVKLRIYLEEKPAARV